jgi:cytosine/adenosine deaminase-related metal-dependent hydrolase
MKILFKSGTIVTMNGRREVLPNADLLVDGDRIEKISPRESLAGNDIDRVFDCAGKIIIPGLISAHTHLTGLVQRGLWDETSFESWSQKSAAAERYLDLPPDDIQLIHTIACIELIRHGVTTVLNMFTAPSKETLSCVNSACRAFAVSGIRGVLGLALKDQAPDDSAQVQGEPRAEAWAEQVRAACGQVTSFGPRVSFALTPSAPQRCSDRLLIACRDLAEELGVAMHTHLAETRHHAEVGRKLYGEPIVHHLAKLDLLGPKLSVAHAIWIDDDEIELLKRHHVGVVHNPSSNMKIASGVARVKKMLDAGLAVGLGADSVNAGTTYSIFEQMKLAVLLPRTHWTPEHWLSPAEAFAMGSAGGAKALGLDATVGSIEEGKKADLTVLNPAISLAPNNALIDELALCENGASVESVFVDGIAVLLERKITGVDEAALRAELAKMEPKIARAKAAALQSQGH